MNPRFVVARCVGSALKTDPPKHPEVVQTRFKLLEPINHEGKRVRYLEAHFFTHSIGTIPRLQQMYQALEINVSDPSCIIVPGKRLKGRHCRLGIVVTEFNERHILQIRSFTTINEPTPRPLIPPEQRANEALTELRIRAHVSNGKLIIDPEPEVADAYEEYDD